MEAFDNQLVGNMNSLIQDVEKLAVKEVSLKEEFLQMRQDMRHIQQFFAFLILKTQHIEALSGLLEKSNLEENLLLLQRGLFKNNICTFSYCETRIYSQRQGFVVTIHQEFLA